MPRKFFRKVMPNVDKVREMRVLSMFGDSLFHPALWHLNRRSAAGGVAVGLFCGLIPGPLQMLGAGIACVLFRVNLPVALVATFYTNPLTIVPLFAVALALFSVIGIVGGSMMAVYGALIGRLFGATAFGQVMGLGALVGLPVAVAAPVVFGAAFDATGGYGLGLFIMVGALATAAVLFALLPSGAARRPAT